MRGTTGATHSAWRGSADEPLFVLKSYNTALTLDHMTKSCMLSQGKTLQAIAVMAAYRAEWPCLIIAPSSLRGAALRRAVPDGVE